MGQLDSAAQELLDACDYVYSDGNTILYADQANGKDTVLPISSQKVGHTCSAWQP